MRNLILSTISVISLLACQTTQHERNSNRSSSSPKSTQNAAYNNVPSFGAGSGRTTISQTGEILARTQIPARYKTLPNGHRVLIGPGVGVAPPVYEDALDGNNISFETIPGIKETVTSVEKVADFRVELIRTPPNFQTVTETVVVSPATVEYDIIPPKYEWVDGEINGSSTETVFTPPTYETVTETVVVQEASTELIRVPLKYKKVNGKTVLLAPEQMTERVVPPMSKTFTRRVLKTPESTSKRTVPHIVKDGKTYMPVTKAQAIKRNVPAVTKEVTRRVIQTPASTQERIVNEPLYKEVTKVISKTPDQYVIRDITGHILKRFETADEFSKFKNNPYKRVTETPVSTFSADVDTASYSFVRQFIEQGQLPPPGSVRVEEMVNYFDYDYAQPETSSDPFKPSITVVPSPWNAETRLVHIGVQGYEASSQPSFAERPDMNLVFLIDVSGSMQPANKLPLLKKSFEPLIKQLRSNDTISIVTYAGYADVALDSVSGADKSAIRQAIAELGSGGSTAGAAGIQRAYELAAQNFKSEGTNRVILATDGDFNVGLSGIEALKAFISDKRKSDIYLSVLGYGVGNLKDDRMQVLAQNGNGIAAYIDSLKEARKFFGQDMGKNMLPIANDLKLQVEFNPKRVAEYRLIGYETRALKREDFNNDKVDAGDIGQGHAVTAIYEINPAGSSRQFVDPLRYGPEKQFSESSFSNEYGFLKIRYKRPGEEVSNLITTLIRDDSSFDAIDTAPQSTRFAAAVAAYGLKLRDDPYIDSMEWKYVTKLALNAKGSDIYGHRAEFVELTRSAQDLAE